MGAEKFAVWEQVTVRELKAYFGFMIQMVMNNLQALIGLFHFISVHALWMTKFSKVVCPRYRRDICPRVLF